MNGNLIKNLSHFSSFFSLVVQLSMCFIVGLLFSSLVSV